MKNIDFDSVAEFYDLYVRVMDDIPFWTEVVAKSPAPRLELMCGTGRITLPVLKAGHSMEGLDHSAGLLDVLRRKLGDVSLTTSLYHADARRFELPRKYGLFFISFNSISEVLGNEAKLELFGCVKRHLAVGGRFWLTIHNPIVRRIAYDGRTIDIGTYDVPGTGEKVEISGTYKLNESTRQVEGVQRYRCTRGEQVTRDIVLPMTFDLIEPAELQRLLALAGLTVDATFGSYDRKPFEPERSPTFIVSCGTRS